MDGFLCHYVSDYHCLWSFVHSYCCSVFYYFKGLCVYSEVNKEIKTYCFAPITSIKLKLFYAAHV